MAAVAETDVVNQLYETYDKLTKAGEDAGKVSTAASELCCILSFVPTCCRGSRLGPLLQIR